MINLPTPATIVKIPKVFHGKLYTAAKLKLDKRIIEHNQKYPTPAFRKNHPRRLQLGEVNVLYNILRCWAAQQAPNVNNCDCVTNIVWINNADIQSGHRDKTNVGRYLGKLAFASLIGGRRATKKDAVRYQDQFGEDPGKGFGWVPVKRFRGTKCDYGILIDPQLIPYDAIPGKVLVNLFLSFPASNEGSKSENFTLPKGNMGSYIYEDMNEVVFEASNMHTEDGEREVFQKASLPGTRSREDEERQAPKTMQVQGDMSKLSEEEKAKIAVRNFMNGSPPPPVDLEPDEGHERTSSPSFIDPPEIEPSELRKGTELTKRYSEKRKAVIYGASLITQYLKKLAPLMINQSGNPGREYVDGCIVKGYHKAVELIESYEDHEATYRRLCACIDRIQGRIQYNPHNFFVPPPNMWFDKDHSFNIIFHGEIYLKPWEKGRQDFGEWKQLTQRVEQSHQKSVGYWADQGPYHALAWSMKHHMCKHHPKDNRLKMADLNKWATGLRLLQKRERITYDRLVEVAKWLLTSAHKEAIYWRKKRGWNFGIRSVSGFANHWKDIEAAYLTHKRKAA